ncbi:MAG TPA: type II CAAX endopeptidase family protein [Pyrinomonadaceae bacterium]|nr:type II CAAX endopeptidase family protein [Pyrinomonadaceae bacterium]
MTLRQVFINDAGRLRSGWRLLVFVLTFIAIFFLVTSLVRLAYVVAVIVFPQAALNNNLQNLLFRSILLFCTLAAAYICTRWLEDLPWRAIGLSLHSGWLRELLIGSVVGIGSMAIAVAIAAAAGGLRFSISTASSQVAKTLIVSCGVFIVAALFEEAMFRGYPLQTLTRARLAWLGVLVTSAVFAAGHLQNPNAGRALATLNTFLAGVWLAIAFLRTRSLWFPLGVHWAWNWALGSLFGLPVSGLTRLAPNPLLRGTDLGPSWLTGGAYGIEGGVACTIALVISTIFIWRTKLVSATEEMTRLTSQELPRARSEGIPTFISDPEVRT